MRTILAVCSAGAMLATLALTTPATAGTPLSAGYEQAQASSQDFSARRYSRRHYRYYRGRYYRPYGYYGPYYGYGPGPYYYGPRYYYPPVFPFPFFPFY